MINPIDLAKNEIEQIKVDIRVALLREDVGIALSRLLTLDPKRGADYQSALDTLGELRK